MKRFLKFFILSWAVATFVCIIIMLIAMIIDNGGVEFIKDSLCIVIAVPIFLSFTFSVPTAIIIGKGGDKIGRWLEN